MSDKDTGVRTKCNIYKIAEMFRQHGYNPQRFSKMNHFEQAGYSALLDSHPINEYLWTSKENWIMIEPFDEHPTLYMNGHFGLEILRTLVKVLEELENAI